MCLIIIVSKVFPYNVSAYFDSWHFVTMYDMLFFVVLHLLPLNNNLKPMSEVLFSRVDFYLLLPRNPIHLGLQPSSQLKVTWTPRWGKSKLLIWDKASYFYGISQSFFLSFYGLRFSQWQGKFMFGCQRSGYLLFYHYLENIH